MLDIASTLALLYKNFLAITLRRDGSYERVARCLSSFSNSWRAMFEWFPPRVLYVNASRCASSNFYPSVNFTMATISATSQVGFFFISSFYPLMYGSWLMAHGCSNKPWCCWFHKTLHWNSKLPCITETHKLHASVLP